MRKRALQIKVVDPEASPNEDGQHETFEAKAETISVAADNIILKTTLAIGAYILADTLRSVIIAKATK